MEYNAAQDRTGAVRQDYLARLRASTAGRRCSLEFNQVLSGHQFIFFVHEMEHECQENELADDQARGLYHPTGGICHRSWGNSASTWPRLRMTV
jgi:hypothetical protein